MTESPILCCLCMTLFSWPTPVAKCDIVVFYTTHICVTMYMRAVFTTHNCDTEPSLPSDDIWFYRWRSTLAQMMACSPAASLFQYCYIINRVPWHSPGIISQRVPKISIHKIGSNTIPSKSLLHLLGQYIKAQISQGFILIYQVLCTLIYRRRSLYSFLPVRPHGTILSRGLFHVNTSRYGSHNTADALRIKRIQPRFGMMLQVPVLLQVPKLLT